MAGLRERKRERTRLAIVDAATALFEQRGYDGTTVADIAAAADIGTRFLTQVQNLYAREQKLVEKYDLTGGQGGGGGEYELQDGFGWTNGVTLKLLELYKAQPGVK